MWLVNMMDKDLENIIKIKLGISDDGDIPDEYVSKLIEIYVRGKTFAGRERKINLLELKKFPYLRRIELSDFMIDDSIVEMLNSYALMESLKLSSCNISSKTLLNSASLKKLKLYYCNVRDYSIIKGVESLHIVGDKNFMLDQILGKERIKRLIVQDSKIKGFATIDSCTNLETLSLEGAIVDDEQALKDIKGVDVKIESEYKPMR